MQTLETRLDGRGVRVGVIVARFNHLITLRLLEGCLARLAELGCDGVDVLWVGHFDLSVSLGIPGEFDNPKFLKAIDQTIAATKKHKKALGRLVPTTDLGIALYKQGFDFCCYSGDVWVLRDALSAAIATLREGCK